MGGYHLNKGLPRCVLKVDLQKVYDSINWDFLFSVLLVITTPLQFVSWVWLRLPYVFYDGEWLPGRLFP